MCSVTRIFAKKVQLVRFLYYLAILENSDLLSKLHFFQVLIPEGNHKGLHPPSHSY